MTQTPVKNTDGTTIESQPRVRHANWTWSRIWTRYRYAIITVINLTVFFSLWQWWASSGNVNNLVFPEFTEVLRALKIGWLGGGNTGRSVFHDGTTCRWRPWSATMPPGSRSPATRRTSRRC